MGISGYIGAKSTLKLLSEFVYINYSTFYIALKGVIGLMVSAGCKFR